MDKSILKLAYKVKIYGHNQESKTYKLGGFFCPYFEKIKGTFVHISLLKIINILSFVLWTNCSIISKTSQIQDMRYTKKY